MNIPYTDGMGKETKGYLHSGLATGQEAVA